MNKEGYEFVIYAKAWRTGREILQSDIIKVQAHNSGSAKEKAEAAAYEKWSKGMGWYGHRWTEV